MHKALALTLGIFVATSFTTPVYATLLLSGPNCNLISGKARLSGGKVRHAKGQTGSLTVSCALNNAALQAEEGQFAFVTYRDSTGTGTGAALVARLVSVDRVTGARKTLTLFNSNDRPETTTGVRAGTVSIPAPIDLLLTFYSLEVTLSRSQTSQVVEFYGADIDLP